MHKNQPFLRRVGFAMAGFVAAWRTELSFRWQLAAACIVFGVLLGLHLEPVWWALVILASAAVIGAELFNTALEHLADHLHPDLHPQIRIVKDCAAAAVLVAACGALGVAVVLIIHLLGR